MNMDQIHRIMQKMEVKVDTYELYVQLNSRSSDNGKIALERVTQWSRKSKTVKYGQ